MSESTLKTVARINQVDIVVIENGEKRVAVKPICDALGIASNGQIEKIKNDEILGPVSKLILSTGNDGKQYEMYCIPFRFIFGWLFGIDHNRVKPESKEAVLNYKLECYNALFNHFTRYADFVELKQNEIEKQLEIVDNAKSNFKNAKNVLDEANEQLKKYRKLTFENYDAETRQLTLFSVESDK